MPNPLDNAGLFLVQTIFNLYILIVMLRIVLHWSGADYYNPLSQFVIRLTALPLKPCKRIFPVIYGIDSSALLFALILEAIKITLLVWFRMNTVPQIGGMSLWALGDLVNIIIDIYFYAIIIQIVISWINPQRISPIVAVLQRVTEPLLRPVRRIIPPIAGIDITPIPVLIFLKLITIMLANPLIQTGIAHAV